MKLLVILLFAFIFMFEAPVLASQESCERLVFRYAKYFKRLSQSYLERGSSTRSSQITNRIRLWIERMGAYHRLLWDAERRNARSEYRQPDYRNIHSRSPLVQAILLNKDVSLNDHELENFAGIFINYGASTYLEALDIDPITQKLINMQDSKIALAAFLTDPYVLAMPPSRGTQLQVVELLLQEFESFVHPPRTRISPADYFTNLMEAYDFELAIKLPFGMSANTYRKNYLMLPQVFDDRYILLALWGDHETLSLLRDVQIFKDHTMALLHESRTASFLFDMPEIKEVISVLEHRLQNKPLLYPADSQAWAIFPATFDLPTLISKYTSDE